MMLNLLVRMEAMKWSEMITLRIVVKHGNECTFGENLEAQEHGFGLSDLGYDRIEILLFDFSILCIKYFGKTTKAFRSKNVKT